MSNIFAKQYRVEEISNFTPEQGREFTISHLVPYSYSSYKDLYPNIESILLCSICKKEILTGGIVSGNYPYIEDPLALHKYCTNLYIKGGITNE